PSTSVPTLVSRSMSLNRPSAVASIWQWSGSAAGSSSWMEFVSARPMVTTPPSNSKIRSSWSERTMVSLGMVPCILESERPKLKEESTWIGHRGHRAHREDSARCSRCPPWPVGDRILRRVRGDLLFFSHRNAYERRLLADPDLRHVRERRKHHPSAARRPSAALHVPVRVAARDQPGPRLPPVDVPREVPVAGVRPGGRSGLGL